MKQGPILILYLPWVLASLFNYDPIVSYLIAWFGSFFIFYMTMSGRIKPLPTDRSIPDQLMRPLFLVQIIFAGYMSVTSIFYFFNVLGYVDFHQLSSFFLIDQDKLMLTAQCQRYYCLGHAAFVSGILVFMKYPVEKQYHVENQTLAGLLLKSALISFPVSILFARLPGLVQFSYQLTSLSFIAGTLALAFAIPLKKTGNTIISILLYLFNFYQALISGFKEPIIISVLVLGLFLYPNYKKLVPVIFMPVLILLFFLLPTYNQIFRQNNWSGDAGGKESAQIALNATLNTNTLYASNWGFFTFRLSEIDMFTQFVKTTPDKIGFYGLTLLKQSATVLIPRIFWPSKPSTEALVMERVYNAGVVARNSKVSAKPAFVVDAYLSAGAFGVFIFLFAYGAIAQLISLKAEKLFGGYILGTALIFSGLFQIFWRGLSFEFLINSVFWSYISMLIIHKLFIISRVLKHV